MSIKYVSYIDKIEHKKIHYSCSGTPYFDQYEYQDIDGIMLLVKVKPINRQIEIDSYKESCDISNILNRFLNGETDLLNAAGEGFYGDVSDAPTTYAEYFEKVNLAKRVFNDLPDDVKAAFDNNPEKFFSEFGSDKFNDIIRSFDKSEDSTSDSASATKESEVENAE